jgi:hypothetical protein
MTQTRFKIDATIKIFMVICLFTFLACNKNSGTTQQPNPSPLKPDSKTEIDSASWFFPLPGDWWAYQTKQEGEWVDGSEYRDSVVSLVRKNNFIYLDIITLTADTQITREWRIDPSGLVTQRIGNSDSWLFITHAKPPFGSIVLDSLKAYPIDCGHVQVDSCVVYQQYDPNFASGDSLANWTGIFQAKNIGVYIRASSEIGDYLRSYKNKGVEHVIE